MKCTMHKHPPPLCSDVGAIYKSTLLSKPWIRHLMYVQISHFPVDGFGKYRGEDILNRGSQILASCSWMFLFSFEDYEIMAVYGFQLIMRQTMEKRAAEGAKKWTLINFTQTYFSFWRIVGVWCLHWGPVIFLTQFWSELKSPLNP